MSRVLEVLQETRDHKVYREPLVYKALMVYRAHKVYKVYKEFPVQLERQAQRVQLELLDLQEFLKLIGFPLLFIIN